MELNLSNEEINSITWYKGEGYDFINKMLRKMGGSLDMNLIKKIIEENNVSEIVNACYHIRNIDNILKRSPYYKGKLYRGMLNIDYNQTFINHSYSSTSSDIRVAQEFSGDKCCLLAFNVTENDKIHYIDMNIFYKKYLNKNDEEYEILLERDIAFHNIHLIGILETRTVKNYEETNVYSCVVQKMPKLNIETLIQQNNLENNLKNLLHLKSSQDGDIYKKKLKNEIEELKYELKQNETQLEKIIIETKNNKIIIDFYQKFQNLKDEFEKQIIDEKLTNILYDTFEQIIKDINDKRRKIKKLKEELYNEKLPSVKIIKIDNIIKNLLKNI
jgi:hypothetical protein